MGLGAALGAGAAGAGIGFVAGPAGAAIGGLLGLVVGALANGGDETAGVPTGGGAFTTPRESDYVQPPPDLPGLTGGPSGGGPLAPFVPSSSPSSAPIETKPDPMTIGGAPATDLNATAANLNQARGGFPVGSSLTKPAWAQSGGSSTSKARAQQQKSLWLANEGNKANGSSTPGAAAPVSSAPVEMFEAARVAARGSEIPTASPKVPMMDTSKGALESAVKQSFAARSANVTSARVLSAAAAGPKSTPRANAGTGYTIGPPVSPSAKGTESAPVEALEAVQEAGKQLAQKTTDRFAGMGAKGRSNVAFRTKK